MTLKIGTKFILELPEGSIKASYEAYPFESLEAFRKSAENNGYPKDYDGKIVYEVSVTGKYKIGKETIKFEKVK